MRVNSLALRLIGAAAAISLVMLVVAGLLLNNLFSIALEHNFDARLRAVLDGLLNDVEIGTGGAPALSQQLADTRFSLPLSGWYWQIEPLDGAKGADLASESLLEKRLVPDPAAMGTRDANGIASFDMVDPNGAKLRVIEQDFILPGSSSKFAFLVAGNFDELLQEVQSFRNTLFIVLALLGAGLVAAIFVQVKFGLRPLRAMQMGLTDIREGKVESLAGEFPTEIEPVAEELNLLLESNTQIIDRARTQVGNLAHALKTPLSVLTNEAALYEGPLAVKVAEQTRIMRDQVSLYLDRARRAARAHGIASVTELAPVLDGLARTVQRIHRDKGVRFEVKCEPGLKFRGERQDLEEMAGNLLDNAGKWASRHVVISAEQQRNVTTIGRVWLILAVEDDGPGLPPEERGEALKRGRRLDETKPGSGLGLNIVSETASMYHGRVDLMDASLGGLRVQIRLPAAI